MECKFLCSVSDSDTVSELIETLWNVNKAGFVQRKKSKLELIETLWNVNEHTISSLILMKDRINRNIVECK